MSTSGSLPDAPSHPPMVAALVCQAVLALAVLGCSTAPPASSRPTSDQRKLRVVATYSILGEWVEQIGGDRVDVVTLVGPGGDAHTYEPTPQDGVALHQADVIFENGLGFESWLPELCANSHVRAQRVVVTRTLQPRSSVLAEGVVEFDPHVWHSPRLAIAMVREVARTLAAIDPQHAAEFQQRANDYCRALEVLDTWIREQLELIPPPRRQLFTTHDTFGYFAEDYGIEVHSILGSFTSEAADPSVAEIAAIVARIQASRVPAIFTENIISPKLTEEVARQAGVTVVPSLYTDALGPPDSAGGSYLQMMRFNVRTMVEALR